MIDARRPEDGPPRYEPTTASVTLALVEFARSREALVDLVASNHPGCSWPVPIVWAGVTVGELHEDGSTRPDPLPGVEWVA